MTQIIIITGAGKGIGKSIALDFAKAAGTHNDFQPLLILASRTASDLESVATQCRSYGAKTDIIQTDIAVMNEVDRLVTTTMERYGTVDCLVNNAGVGRFKDIGEMT